MGFVYLLIITLTITATLRFSVHSLLQSTILFFHQNCLDRLPTSSSALPELKALVCGENFSDAKVSQIYIATGLIHLFVVSGAHLLLLEKILTWVTVFLGQLPTIFILSALFIYVLACDMNPPITRSFISLLISGFLIRNHLHWPASFKLLLIGLLTLALNPDWVNSASLQLSWIAGLVVSLNTHYFTKHSFLFKQSLYFIFLWPLLIFLCVPSHLIILINLVFTPVLEFILFPIGLLTWLFPFLHSIFDHLIELLNFVLQLLEFNPNYQTSLDINQLTTVGWLVILLLHFCLHLIEMTYRRVHYV